MANVEYFVFEDTTTNVDAIKRSNLIAYDTTKDSAIYYKEDGTTIRTLLTLDATYNTVYALGNMQMGDGKYLGLGDAKGRIQFDDETTDTISFLSCDLITSGNLTIPTAKWIGLGSAKGRIEFTDAATDLIYIQSCNLLVGGAFATTAVIESRGTTEQFRISYDSASRTQFLQDDATGQLNLTPIGDSSSRGTINVVGSFKTSFDAASFTSFVQADTTGILTLTPTADAGRGQINVVGDFKVAYDAASHALFSMADTSGYLTLTLTADEGNGRLEIVGDEKLGTGKYLFLGADGKAGISSDNTNMQLWGRIGGGTGNIVISDDADFYSVGWTDYSATSTVVGWSSFVEKKIYYKKIGKIVFVTCNLSGTSDSTSVSFTLPYTSSNTTDYATCGRASDNGGSDNVGVFTFGKNTSTCNVSYGTNMAGWTAANAKYVYGQFWYESA